MFDYFVIQSCDALISLQAYEVLPCHVLYQSLSAIRFCTTPSCCNASGQIEGHLSKGKKTRRVLVYERSIRYINSSLTKLAFVTVFEVGWLNRNFLRQRGGFKRLRTLGKIYRRPLQSPVHANVELGSNCVEKYLSLIDGSLKTINSQRSSLG